MNPDRTFTSEQRQRIDKIASAAMEMPTTARRAFVSSQCSDDPAVRDEILSLLEAAERTGQSAFMNAPATLSPLEPAPPKSAADEDFPRQIGNYRLIEKIGEGGFGIVYLAEQEKPVRRRVALKIIKLGMDTKQVIARFEQERQALAMMEHPNIAKVLDAGSTDTGRPFFVMELVTGVPITEFCDKQNMSFHERLALFVPVCAAVQHAHQKGIIHRDIKPSNVLVTLVDDKPVPKVIDFGIAKATQARLTEETMFTELGQFIGTPAYMSPEQAEPMGTDIDTRSDIYSLGVLLYELLTGVTPFDVKTLRQAGFDEIKRMIREVDPPRPSTRLSMNAATLASVAAQRHVEPRKLVTLLRGELDWIVMKALEKDRARRYDTANGLAMDIQRFLAGEVVTAAPPSNAYRLKKFIRRNRLQVAAGSAVALALVLGLIGTALALKRALAAESGLTRQLAETTKAQLAEKERADQLKQVSDFQSEMLAQIDTRTAGEGLMADVRHRFAAALEKAGVPDSERASQAKTLGDLLLRVNATDTAAAMVDRTILKPAIRTIDKQFKNDPRTDASLRQSLAELYRTIGLYDAALPLQESALATRRRVLGDEHVDTLSSTNKMGLLLENQGKLPEAEPFYREALEKRRHVLGEDHQDTLVSINNMGLLLEAQGKLTAAEPFYRDALEKRRRVLGEEHPDTISSINNMGYLLESQGKLAEAETYDREALEKSRRVLGEDHPSTIASINGLASLLRNQGKFDEAEAFSREALERNRRVLGEEHPTTLISINNMGALLQSQGKLEDAAPYFREALDKRRRVLGEDHPETIAAINNMGNQLRAQGELANAEPYFREALEKYRRVMGEEHPNTLLSINNLGTLLQGQGKLAEAEPYYREALEKRRRTLGDEHPSTLNSLFSVGIVLQAQGKLDLAEPLFRKTIEASTRVQGAEHPLTVNAISNLGRLLLTTGKPQEALDVLAAAEPIARKMFTGSNQPRLGAFLSGLGRARVMSGWNAERFTLAESNLLEAQTILLATRTIKHKETVDCIQGLIDLYSAWHTAEPDKGYDSKAAELKQKIVDGKAPTNSAATSPATTATAPDAQRP